MTNNFYNYGHTYPDLPCVWCDAALRSAKRVYPNSICNYHLVVQLSGNIDQMINYRFPYLQELERRVFHD